MHITRVKISIAKRNNSIMGNFKKVDIVRFIPEYKDGQSEFDYLLLEDPDGGRVKVSALNTGMSIPPVQVVKTCWLILKSISG